MIKECKKSNKNRKLELFLGEENYHITIVTQNGENKKLEFSFENSK